MNFDSKRCFKIWIYTVSHSVLILRSVNDEEEEVKGYNIDVELWGVVYLELPDVLNGIKIKKVNNLPKKFDVYKNKEGYNVFEIISESGLYYVVATGCKIGKNNWLNENRVLNPYLEYDEIVAIL